MCSSDLIGLDVKPALYSSYASWALNTVSQAMRVSSVCSPIIALSLNRKQASYGDCYSFSFSVWWAWYVWNQCVPASGTPYNGSMTLSNNPSGKLSSFGGVTKKSRARSDLDCV